MRECGGQLQATDEGEEKSWTCDRYEGHDGPHKLTFDLDCVTCELPITCSVEWDQHPAGHGLRTV